MNSFPEDFEYAYFSPEALSKKLHIQHFKILVSTNSFLRAGFDVSLMLKNELTADSCLNLQQC